MSKALSHRQKALFGALTKLFPPPYASSDPARLSWLLALPPSSPYYSTRCQLYQLLGDALCALGLTAETYAETVSAYGPEKIQPEMDFMDVALALGMPIEKDRVIARAARLLHAQYFTQAPWLALPCPIKQLVMSRINRDHPGSNEHGLSTPEACINWCDLATDDELAAIEVERDLLGLNDGL